MKKPALIAGIDGGGTKTHVIIGDPEGTILAEVTEGPSNFQVIGPEAAASVLLSGLARGCEKLGHSPSHLQAVVAGLTGAGRESDQERMKQALGIHAKKSGVDFKKISIESDARVALEGAFRGAQGIILIGGTGSIAVGKTAEGEIHRVGGWGRMIGDEGSGYVIGREGLQAVTKELDGRGKKTSLTRMFAERFKLSTHEDIIAAVYRKNFDIASLAPLVIEAAGKNDSESGRILNRAAFELSEHVRALTLRLERATRKPRQKIPLAFIGSLLSAEGVFSRIVRQKIEFSTPQILVRKPDSPPAYGALIMARALLSRS